MALPVISSYPMPAAAELPENKVSWKPDPKRAVLLIHDMQRYFVNAFAPGESPVIDLLANIRLLRERCAGLGIPVIYTAQPGDQTAEQRGLLRDFWGDGLKGVPEQEQIVEELQPEEGDILLTKWRYSGFQKTDLLKIMHAQGRDQLIVCGVYAHIGCLMTACEAFMQDVQPFVVADAVADFSLEHHRMALTYAAERCAVTIPARQLLDGLADTDERDEAVELDQAPKTTSLAAAAACGQPLTREQVREQVAGILRETPENIGINDDLINDWGLDSIRIMSLVERWRRGGAELTFVDMAERPTLADWWRMLSAPFQQTMPNMDYLV